VLCPEETGLAQWDTAHGMEEEEGLVEGVNPRVTKVKVKVERLEARKALADSSKV